MYSDIGGDDTDDGDGVDEVELIMLEYEYGSWIMDQRSDELLVVYVYKLLTKHRNTMLL